MRVFSVQGLHALRVEDFFNGRGHSGAFCVRREQIIFCKGNSVNRNRLPGQLRVPHGLNGRVKTGQVRLSGHQSSVHVRRANLNCLLAVNGAQKRVVSFAEVLAQVELHHLSSRRQMAEPDWPVGVVLVGVRGVGVNGGSVPMAVENNDEFDFCLDEGK